MKNRVRETREQQGMTQTFLAKKVQRSRGFISNVERGTQVPSVYIGNLMAEVLNSTSEALFPAQNVIHDSQDKEKEAVK
ncbi:helix-turn-helix transcriptional regulator [Secundilactobacillus muriivasis]